MHKRSQPLMPAVIVALAPVARLKSALAVVILASS